MASPMEMIGFLPQVIDIVMKLALFGIAVFFGKIALSGWRGKIDFVMKIAGIFILGFICFIVGLLLPFDFLPQVKFISELLNSFIVAAFFYITLFLLSAKSEEAVSKKDIFSVTDEVHFLRRQITRINKALTDKGIQAKAISSSQIKPIVEKYFDKRKHSISSSELKGDAWEVKAKSGAREYFIQIDAFSGEILSVRKKGFDVSALAERFKKDKLFFAGSFLLVVFVIFTFSLLTPDNISRVSETFNFYGVSIETRDRTCLTPAEVLNLWNDDEDARTDFNYDETRVFALIEDRRDGVASPFFYGNQAIVYSNGTYALFIVSEERATSMVESLSLFQSALISGKGEICSVKLEDYTLCTCSPVSDPRVSIAVTNFLNTLTI